MDEDAALDELGILGEGAAIDVLAIVEGLGVEGFGVEVDDVNLAHHAFSGGTGIS